MIDLKVTDAMLALIRTVLCDDAVVTDEEAEIIKNNLHEIFDISKRNDMAHLVGVALEAQGLDRKSVV